MDSAHSIESQLREELEDSETTLLAVKEKLRAARQTSSSLALKNMDLSKMSADRDVMTEEMEQLRQARASHLAADCVAAQG